MTRWLLVTVLLMLVFSLATEFVLQDPGYIFIAVGNKTLHMRFWPAVMLICSLAWLIYLLAALGKRLLALGRGQGWRSKETTGAGSKRQQALWLHYFEGNWARLLKESTRMLSKKAELIPCLMAAEAAAELGDLSQQQLLLTQAEHSHPRQILATNLVAARLAAQQNDWLQVIRYLRHLREQAPEHLPALQLLARAYRERRDWPELASLLPDLKRLKALTAGALLELEQITYAHLLEGAATVGFEALQNAWQGLSKTLKTQPHLVLSYGYALINLQRSSVAEAVVRKHLQRHWSDELIALYGLLAASAAEAQLTQAESWLAEHPKNSHLLLALGRICWRLHYWGKARDYFEQALQLAPSAQTYAALAQVYGQLGETAKSHALYERGLTEQAKLDQQMRHPSHN